MVHNVQLTSSMPKMLQFDNPVVKFAKEDAQRLHHPHNDALVVSIQLGDYNTH